MKVSLIVIIAIIIVFVLIVFPLIISKKAEKKRSFLIWYAQKKEKNLSTKNKKKAPEEKYQRYFKNPETNSLTKSS